MIKDTPQALTETQSFNLKQRALTEDVETIGRWFANCYAASQLAELRWPHARAYVNVITSAWQLRQPSLPSG